MGTAACCPGMLRSLLVVYLGLMLLCCSRGDGSSATENGSTGSTTQETGATSNTTAGATSGPTSGPTTGPESTTTGVTDGTDTSTMTGPPVSSMPDDHETNGGPAPDVTCGELPPGVVGEPYSAFVEASGGAGNSYEWEFHSNKPAWLSLIYDGSDVAELAGVPDEAGVFMFSLWVFNNGTEEPGFASCILPVSE